MSPLKELRERVEIRVLDLFSGIGGFSLGLERCGRFQTIGFCEIEPYQRAVLEKHWPNVTVFPDIRTLSQINCDLICGGFPCQPFSTASRGRRVAEDLWPQMFRVIDANRPLYVVAENVSEPAVRSAAADLAGIGYTVSVRNISGNDCGAPHGRSRWWAIAHPYQESEFQRALDAEVAKLPILCQGLWTAQTYARALRVSNGIPYRVHRTEALGNTVIPQIPQVIGNAIVRSRRLDSPVPRPPPDTGRGQIPSHETGGGER